MSLVSSPAHEHAGGRVVNGDDAMVFAVAFVAMPVAITRRPSDEKARNLTRLPPSAALASAASALCQVSLPVAASQTRTIPSPWPVTIRSPAADHAARSIPRAGVESSWTSRRPVRTS